MALPDFSMRQLLEAGVHFGHQAHRWNPKMGSYIFGLASMSTPKPEFVIVKRERSESSAA